MKTSHMRQFRFAVCAAVRGLTLCTLAALTGFAAETSEQLEEGFTLHRQAIHSAELELTATTRRTVFDANETATYRIFSTEGSYRIDIEVEQVPENSKHHPGYRSFVRREGKVLFYTTDKPEPGVDVVPIIWKEQSHSVSRPGGMMPSPEPRLIGTIPSTILNLSNYDLHGVVGNTRNVVETNVETAERNGVSCLRLEYIRPNGATNVWIDPIRDHEIIAIEAAHKQSLKTLDCELQEVPGYGWFPKHTMYRELHQEKAEPLVLTQEIGIKVVSLNRELNDDLFDFKAMGVAVGTTIHDTSGDALKMMVLTDTGLVEFDRAGLQRIQTPPPSSSPWKRPLLIANAAACLALAVFLVLRWTRNRAKSSN